MSVENIKSIFSRNKNDLAFILGNGINYYYNKSNVSWKDLLLDLWDAHSFNTLSTIPKGVSFTEFYDALEIQNYAENNFSSILQKSVVAKMENWEPIKSQNLILNRIKEMNAPLLTTNFDDLIPKSLDLNFYKLTDEGFTDFYPWSCYYSDKELDDPVNGFGVWYINGMVKYHRSIKLGLSQYMGNVERARKLITGPENFTLENDWPGRKTWLNIILNKSLFIFGLSLDETEIFIRWLLIERAKLIRRVPSKKHKGWFITKKESTPQAEGKKFFLESVGFEIVEVNNYKMMYEDMWK